MTSEETRLLEKGLTFIPTRDKVNTTSILADLCEWERRMRLKKYYYDKKTQNEPITEDSQDMTLHDKIKARERNKIFIPPTGRDKNLDLYIDLVKEDILKNISRKHNSNLTDKERNALKTLMNDQSIIIRPADKGSGIVIMDTDDYIKKVNEDLSQNNTYQKQKKDLTTLTNNKVTKIVKEMHKNGIIDDNLKKYMTPTLSRPGSVKANPKVHKEGHPIRTIISGINHPTEKMAEIAEHELDEWVGKLPT